MATGFPTSLDTLTNPSNSDGLDSPNHASQHSNANDAVEAVQTKVGIDSSADTNSHDYKIASAQTDIITNASDISDNATDIATNVTDIATNAADIAANTAALDGVEASAVTMDVEQTSHGLAVGDIVKSSGTDGEYDKAQADSAANAEVVGIVTVVADANNFTLITSGLVDVAAAVPNEVAGTVLFLDESTAGALTATEPATDGNITKPIAIITTDNSEMQLVQFRGVEVQTTAALDFYPIGAIYISVLSTSPATLFGGTWSAFGTGRTLVGIDSGDTDFDTSEEETGSKTSAHTHSDGSLYAHFDLDSNYSYAGRTSVSSWTVGNQSTPSGNQQWGGGSGSRTTGVGVSGTTGSDSTSVVQPSIVVYMWKRTA